MNAQEIFNTVLAHSRTMVEKSSGEVVGKPDVTCLYRGRDGAKCFAGILIPDEEYHKDMEGLDFREVCKRFADSTRPTLLSLREHRALISELQSIHDGSSLQDWEKEFGISAEWNHLSRPDPVTA